MGGLPHLPFFYICALALVQRFTDSVLLWQGVLTFRVLEAHWKAAHMEKYIVKLTLEEREELLILIRVGKKAANKLMHARVLLSADANDTKLKQKTDEEIATEMHVSSKTVARIRQRFVEEGMESALSRRPHANPKSRKIDGEQEAHLVALCCSTPPEGRMIWVRMSGTKLRKNKSYSSIIYS
ncbi:hypothetical protein TUM19329_09700 [Legionella antarctica]|uniref:Helix-turn-helix domain-containing protein n=2 Tax=Legionella antarctica TaxID=2708020 RepID=A0A6F8T2F4_9GAMM|nr:hypothetical protein TUM19329_09700 [Legionella antarctica]